MEGQIMLIKLASEISLKSTYVKAYFTKNLAKNIKEAFKQNFLSKPKIQKGQGVMLLKTENPKKALSLLKKVFGISSIALGEESYVEDISSVKQKVLAFGKKYLKKGDSFALRVNRVGKHSFTSHNIAVECGAEIMKAIPSLKVNLSKPEKEIFVELLDKKLILYKEKIPGAKGLPLGVEGKIAVLLEGESSEREILSAWLLMKRGCRIIPIILEEKNKSQKEKIKKTLSVLKDWNCFRELNPLKAKDLGELKFNFYAIALCSSALNEKTLEEMQELSEKHNILVLNPLLLFPEELR